MTRFLLSAIIVFNSQNLVSQTKKYVGAWFEIEYPQNFISKGSLKSSTGDGFDSVVFASPDEKVEFYVFSPQWDGDAIDISLKSNEILQNSETKISNDYKFIYWTIIANDKSYKRSYQEVINLNSNTKFVIGIKYSNSESYEKYKKSYLEFKKSLIQYTD